MLKDRYHFFETLSFFVSENHKIKDDVGNRTLYVDISRSMRN